MSEPVTFKPVLVDDSSVLRAPLNLFTANAAAIHAAIESLIVVPDTFDAATALHKGTVTGRLAGTTTLKQLADVLDSLTIPAAYTFNPDVEGHGGTTAARLAGITTLGGLADAFDALVIPASPDLTPYAKLDGTNQPFTGNVTVSKSNPKLIATDTGLNSSAYLEKQTTLDGTRLVSQNRRYQPANALSLAYSAGNNPSWSLTTFSLSCWYWSDNQNYQSIFSSGTAVINFRGQAVSPPYIRVSGFGGSTIDFNGPAGQPALAGRWTHLVITRNASTGAMTFYYDGVASPQSGSIVGTTTHSPTNPLTTNGDLDEFIVYDKVLSQSEVTALYNSGVPNRITNYDNVYTHLSMDQTTGTTATDNSGNGRHVTGITGAAWVTGKVLSTVLEPITETVLLKIQNNATLNSYGDFTIGYYAGVYGTSNVYEGLLQKFNILGSNKLSISSSGVTFNSPILTATTFNASIAAGTTISAGTSLNAATQVYTGAGLVGTPSHSFSSDTNTGMYSGGSDILKLVTAGANRISIIADGKVGFGDITPTALLDVNSDVLRLRTAKTPASATAAGNAGDICWDANYLYVCTATNTWKRTALSTW